jgi:hypothetical protein
MILSRTVSSLRRAAQAQRDALVPLEPAPRADWREEEDEKYWAKIAMNVRNCQTEPPAHSPDERHKMQLGATTVVPSPPPSPLAATPDVPVVAPEPQPTAPPPEPPSMAQTLHDISALIRQYLFCSEDQLTVLALWVVHTYGFEYFSVTPYLNICSPESQSGKTVCLSLLDLLCHNPWMPSGLTPARLISHITNSQPTLLLDNWDTFFRPSDAQSFVGFLNAGSAHGNRFVTRPDDRDDDWDSDESMHGNRFVTRPGHQDLDKSNFCPKAFAGQGRLPASLAARCIPIVLQRRKPTKHALPFWRDIVFKDAFRLVEPIPGWLKKNADALRHAALTFLRSPSPTLSMHQRDLAAPLRALAELAGGKWPRRTSHALLRLLNACPAPPTVGLQLLEDIRSFFTQEHDPSKIHTAPLLVYLNRLEDRPWTKKNLTPKGLCDILQHFPIPESGNQRIGKDNFKGFTFRHFVESWELYTPHLSSRRAPSPVTNASAPVTNARSPVTNDASLVTNEPSLVPKISANEEIPNVFNTGAGAST